MNLEKQLYKFYSQYIRIRLSLLWWYWLLRLLLRFMSILILIICHVINYDFRIKYDDEVPEL